jgi:oligoribonuclease NrnB/cAMP/cGMP phosphodiesterase (DHH superfamily)
VKVFYHNDNDGRCAAFLFWKYVTKTGDVVSQNDFIEINYTDKIPHEVYALNEMVYFLDFHPDKEDDYIILCEKACLCIIDHHKTAIDNITKWEDKYQFGTDANFALDTSYCGAMIVWREFFTDTMPPYFLDLVDDWDCWKHKLPETKAFNAGSRLYDTSPFGGFWETLYYGSFNPFHTEKAFLNEVIESGKLILKATDMQAKEAIKSFSFEVEFEGYKCLALNQGRCNSTWFDSKPGYDIYIPFVFNGKIWTVSLYSVTIDVSEIAKKYGGGGHPGASGFQCSEIPFVRTAHD